MLRLRGLIGRDVYEVRGLWIKPCNQIHMLHMKTAIDVVYLNKELTIVKIDSQVPIGKICKTVRAARSVIELPPGRAAELGLNEGDRVELSKGGRGEPNDGDRKEPNEGDRVELKG